MTCTPKYTQSSNPIHTYVWGLEFGVMGYVTAAGLDDAHEQIIDDYAEVIGTCDHGGDLTDQQVWESGGCDCTPNDSGQFVWAVYLWMNDMHIRAEVFDYYRAMWSDEFDMLDTYWL